MKIKLLLIALFCQLLSLSAVASDVDLDIPVDSWTGIVLQGNRVCEGTLVRANNGRIDLTVSMEVYFHGKLTIKKYTFKDAPQVQSAISSGLVRSAYRGQAGNVQMLAAVFLGPEGNEFRDLLMITVKVPHGSHAHTYQCRF